jgi:hypothetical protein
MKTRICYRKYLPTTQTVYGIVCAQLPFLTTLNFFLIRRFSVYSTPEMDPDRFER